MSAQAGSSDETPSRSLGTSGLARVIAEHQAYVWRYLRFLGADGPTADDLCQDSFVAVLGRDQQIRARALRSYLKRVAHNLYSAHLRRQGRLRALDEVQGAELAFDLFCEGGDGEDYLQALRECLATLDRRSRQALDLRYREGCDRAGIGRALGIAESGVKSLLARGKARLRKCIEWRRG